LRRSWVTLTLKQGLICVTQCPFPSRGRRIKEERRQRRREEDEEDEEGDEEGEDGDLSWLVPHTNIIILSPLPRSPSERWSSFLPWEWRGRW